MSQTKFTNPLSSNPTPGSPMSPSPSGERSKGGPSTGSGAASTHDHGPGTRTGRDGDLSKDSEKEQTS